MGNVRTIKEERFAQIANEPLNDKRLSFKARGILAYLMSKPNDWQCNMVDIERHSETEGKQSIRNAFKELAKFGYVRLVSQRQENGHFVGKFYEVFEKPAFNPDFTENHVNGKSVEPSDRETDSRVNRSSENHEVNTNTNTTNTDRTNTDTTKKESFPSGKLYKSAIDVYYRWYEKRFGVKPKIDGVQGSSMKKLLKNIAQISETKDDQKIIDSLRYIFEHWDYLDQFNQKQVELKNINGNLNNIVVQINQRKNKYVTDNGNFRNFLNL